MSQTTEIITENTGTGAEIHSSATASEQGTAPANAGVAAGSTFTPPTIYSETVGHIGSFEVRNTWIMSIISVVFFCVIAWRFFR